MANCVGGGGGGGGMGKELGVGNGAEALGGGWRG